MLRVLTFNVWAGHYGIFDKERFSEQVCQVKEVGCDVLCLQEAFSQEVLDMYADAFAETHQLFVSPKEKQRPVRFLNLISMPSLYANPLGLAVLIRRSLMPLFHDVHNYVTRPSLLSLSWTSWIDNLCFPRGAMLCSVEYAGQRIMIVNTHLSFGEWMDECRQHQLQEVIPHVAKEFDDVIICGDLNMNEVPPVLHDMGYTTMQNQRLSTWVQHNPFTRGWLQREEDEQIDYVLLSDSLWQKAVIATWGTCMNKRPWTSDHLGMMAVIGVEKQNNSHSLIR